MAKLTVWVRTRDNLLELLAASKSAEWRIAQGNEDEITHVKIFNFNGSQVIEGVFDRNDSYRNPANGDLILVFLDGKIVNCDPPFEFPGQLPFGYIRDNE